MGCGPVLWRCGCGRVDEDSSKQDTFAEAVGVIASLLSSASASLWGNVSLSRWASDMLKCGAASAIPKSFGAGLCSNNNESVKV